MNTEKNKNKDCRFNKQDTKYEELDLHYYHPSDVKSITELFIIDCYEKGINKVKIITGKGIGIVRNMVISVLKKVKYVKYFYTAPEYESGIGAIYVVLKDKDNYNELEENNS